MFRRNKCQAKNPDLCTDPNCPERMYLKNAFKAALAKGDFNAFMDAKEQEERLEPVFIQTGSASEWDRLVVAEKGKDNSMRSIAIDPVEKASYTRDITKVEKFDSWKDMGQALNADPNVIVVLWDNHGPWNNKELPGFSLSEFYVSPKLRGQGAGKNIIQTLTQHADENNLTISCVPTEAGDGRLQEGQEGWAEAALAHKKRLTAFYERHGFEENPFYHNSNKVDYLTKEPIVPNLEGQKKFTAKAEKILRDHSMYIRYPNGKYPKGWLKKTS